LEKIPSSQKYPLKFSKSDKVKLTIRITKPEGDFEKCIKQSVLIHHFDFSPTFTTVSDFTSFEFGTILEIIITPEITKTDPNLKKLKPIERGCYFEGEKLLHFFKKYSQKNCEIECMANITIAACGCVDIDQPFKSRDDICLNISRIDPTCVSEIQNDVYLLADFVPEYDCSCLPLCNTISYNMKYYTMHEKEEKILKSFHW
jgi:amiloride-sensitive sodium channel